MSGFNPTCYTRGCAQGAKQERNEMEKVIDSGAIGLDDRIWKGRQTLSTQK